MFTFDPRMRGLPATREQVVSLHESINQPHVAIPGKHAGPARGYVLGLRGQGGFNVFIYLHLPESTDCAVYVSDRRNLSPPDFASEEAEAVSFVESMGFMVDNMNFRSQPLPRQEELVKTLAVFQREPKPVNAGKGADAAALSPLGRLLGSF